MKLLDQFQSFIAQEQLLGPDDKVLLAVSGGLDSVVMAHLCASAGLKAGIAHCNFGLRGPDSMEDEQFVRTLAQQLNFPFHTISFPTTIIAQERKQSIQLVARDLRYSWLEEIRAAGQYQAIATAHHLNDSIETFLYNFTKGTGLRGLRGIPFRNGHIIRPLLFAKRTALERFAKEQEITFKVDSSNVTDKYARNKIRHHVVPVLKQINPSLEETSTRSLQHMGEAFYLYELAVEHFRKEWVEELEHKEVRIKKEGLRQNLRAAATLLYECIRQAGFGFEQVTQLLTHLDTQAGALFYAPGYRLLVDRHSYVLAPIEKVDDNFQLKAIDAETDVLRLSDLMLTFSTKKGQPTHFSPSSAVAYLDVARLNYPLTIRRWQKGDVFCPLGMKGKHQKLQDYFTNNGFSRFEKERAWLLTNGDGEIIWLVGHRLDDRFKIEKDTNTFLEITIIKDDL